MTDLVITAVERVTKTWREEAEERRRISKLDPVADTLDYCAGEISARLRTIGASHEALSVEEYAAQASPPVTPQTVRVWIRTGQLPAIQTTKGYKIDRNAKRARRVG